MDTELTLVATLKELKGSRAIIHVKLIAYNKVCDTCHGVFVAVKEGHPAFHRWDNRGNQHGVFSMIWTFYKHYLKILALSAQFFLAANI